MKLAQILVYWLVIAAAPHASGFDNIESWADELIEPAIASGRANGVSIGLVENGEVAFLKAYGWEDEDRQIPLDPHASVFRMCSISKSFIATAIMQLIEQGQIKSLDDPVNQYLKRLQLPPPHGDDVTLRQLMTHSAGMAGHAQPQGTTLDLPVPMSEAEVGQYFLESIETVPGTHSQYANLGVSLQGVVIEDVTGKELSAHLADSIFAPLGMSQSLLHYSMTTPERLAVPYGRFPNGELLAVPFYPKHPLGAASGGVMSTTADMLKYAAFHADETGVLYPDVLAGPLRAEMHRPHFRNSDAHDGVGLHFFPATFGNTRTASHGCGLPGTNSYLVVMPDINAALVISVLAGSNPPLLADLFDMWREQGRYDPAGEFYDLDLLGSGELYRAFAEEYLGEPQRPSITSDSFDPKAVTDVEEQVGTYWTERRSFTTPMVMLSMASVREVARSGDELEMGGKRFKALAPGIYEQTESGARIAFRRPWEGAPVFLNTESSSFRQVSGLGNPALTSGLFVLGFMLSLVGFGALAKPKGVLQQTWPRRLSVTLSVLVLLFFAIVFVGTEFLGEVVYDATNGVRPRMDAALSTLRFYVLISALLVALIVYGWWRRRERGSIVGRSLEVLLVLICVITWPGAVAMNLFSGW